MRGHLPAALVPLERALRLAEPEEYIGTFVDEGRPMATLLQTAVKHGIALGYVSRLVARFRAPGDQSARRTGLYQGRATQ